MAKVHVVEEKVRMSRVDIIHYQILTYCFLKRIAISETDVQCLTLLGLSGEQDLSDFCNREDISDEVIRQKEEALYKAEYKSKGKKRGLYASAQTVRNVLSKHVQRGFVIKEGRGKKKKIRLNPALGIVCQGSRILLDFKMIYVEPGQS